MPKCNWCGRSVGNSLHVAFWYCSEKCRREAKGSRSSTPSAPAGGGVQIDVTPIIKGIASLFGKGKKAETPVPPLSKKPASPPPVGPTMAELQEMRTNIEERNKNIATMKEELASSRSAVRDEIERLKAKRDAILRKQANANQGTETHDSTTDANAGSGDILHQIEKLGEMLTKGYITQQEFDQKKADLLKRL